MTSVIASVQKSKKHIVRKTAEFAHHHTCLAFLAVMIGMPVALLAAVSVSVMALTFPIAWICGWM